LGHHVVSGTSAGGKKVEKGLVGIRKSINIGLCPNSTQGPPRGFGEARVSSKPQIQVLGW
jgi:hypothetical protein